jgi:SAM-dependent methyltransferase
MAVAGWSIRSVFGRPAHLVRSGVAAFRGAPDRLFDLDAFDRAQHGAPPRWDRCAALMRAAMERAGVREGRLLEIGGRKKPLRRFFPDFDYVALDMAEDVTPGFDIIVADITSCPQIPSKSFDVIISLDVFEHIDRPWLAAAEITRLLKPGGVTAHSTLFSWRYHPCPIDYWRFSPAGLRSLFPRLKCLNASFDYSERRFNMTKVSRHGIGLDELGGWRENVRVHYAGMRRRRKASAPHAG